MALRLLAKRSMTPSTAAQLWQRNAQVTLSKRGPSCKVWSGASWLGPCLVQDFSFRSPAAASVWFRDPEAEAQCATLCARWKPSFGNGTRKGFPILSIDGSS